MALASVWTTSLTSGFTAAVRPSIIGACLEVILQQKIIEVIFYKDEAEIMDFK